MHLFFLIKTTNFSESIKNIPLPNRQKKLNGKLELMENIDWMLQFKTKDLFAIMRNMKIQNNFQKKTLDDSNIHVFFYKQLQFGGYR